MTRLLNIRDVQPSDFKSWSILWDGYNAFYERTGPTALAPEITQTTWARFFDAAEPVHALVAEQDGALLGLAHYLFHRSTILIGPNCYLQDLFTDETTRGKGVGRALIKAVQDEAGKIGVTNVYWMTHETNTTARRLYDRVARRTGFIEYDLL